MKPMFLRILCLCLPAFAVVVGEQCLIRDGDRVIIYGDSITAGAEYPNYGRYVEAYFRTRFPDWSLEFWNRGQSGDTASNVVRFERDCLPLRPDVITINMGMNDAGYTPEIHKRLRTFIDALARMIDAAREVNPEVRIVLVSPILYEYAAREARAFYPYVLWCYAQEERRLAERKQVVFIDLTRLYGQSVGLAQGLAPNRLVFSGDGIHPATFGGHLLIAAHVIRGLGAARELGALTLDAADGRVVAARGQTVSVTAAEGKAFIFERALDALPFPAIREANGVTYMDPAIAFSERLADELNRDTLRVTGLSAPAYRLSIDGQVVGDVGADELSDGVNLSWFGCTPDVQQARGVVDAVGAKQVAQWRAWHSGLKSKEAGTSVDQDAGVREAREAIVSLARPARRRFELTPIDGIVDRYRRHEQMVRLSPAPRLHVVQGEVSSQDVEITVHNLSGRARRVELVWSDSSVDPDATVVELAAGEEQRVPFRIELREDERAPVLKVCHMPRDLSFPSIVETLIPAVVPEAYVARTDGALKIDGDLDEWAGATALSVDVRLTPAVARRRLGPADLSVDARVMRDEDALYVAARVRDQAHVNHFDDDRVGWDDALIVAVNGKRYTVALAGGGVVRAFPADDAIRAAAVRCEGTTSYELMIPWTALGVEDMAARLSMSFNLSVSDRDHDESYKTVSWAGHSGDHVAGSIRLGPME